MAVELSYTRTVELLREAVAEKPEGYIYINPQGETADVDKYGLSLTSCDYFDPETGEPSCIVGQVLAAVGVSKGHFYGYEGSTALAVLDYLDSKNILTASHKAAKVLAKAQFAQDRGTPWAEAVENAIKETELL